MTSWSCRIKCNYCILSTKDEKCWQNQNSICINVTLCLFPCNKNNSLPTSLGHHIFFLTEQVSSSKDWVFWVRGPQRASASSSKCQKWLLYLIYSNCFPFRSFHTYLPSLIPYFPHSLLFSFYTFPHNYFTAFFLSWDSLY